MATAESGLQRTLWGYRQRMNQVLKGLKRHRNEDMQRRAARGLAFGAVAMSNGREKQETSWACGSKQNFGKQGSPCPGAKGAKLLEASAASSQSCSLLPASHLLMSGRRTKLTLLK